MSFVEKYQDGHIPGLITWFYLIFMVQSVTGGALETQLVVSTKYILLKCDRRASFATERPSVLYFVFNLSLIFISRWVDQIKLQISWWWTDLWGCCSTPLWHPQPQFAQLRQFWHHQDKYFSEGGTSNISLPLLIHSFLLKWKLYR